MLMYKVGEKNNTKRCTSSDIDANQFSVNHYSIHYIIEIILLSGNNIYKKHDINNKKH